jgi:response regulator of citrate/malate metabolism
MKNQAVGCAFLFCPFFVFINYFVRVRILLQRSNGIALQTISKAVGISRNTVKKYLRLIEVKGFSHAELLQ